MDWGKTTKVTFYEKRAVSVSSQMNGANLDTVGFNMKYIGQVDPTLAIRIYEILQDAKQIDEHTPAHPEEDFVLAEERLRELGL